MKEKIKNSIKLLVESINKETRSEDALRFTQAMLNAAHAINVLENNK